MKKIIRIIAFQSFLFSGLYTAGQTPVKPRDPSIKGPQTFAIIMGISKYKYVRPLNYADKDAELFRDFLKSPGGGNVKEENIYCLLNDKANSTNFFVKGFQWLRAKQLQKGDKLFIYLAGHGDAIDEEQFFFLGYDCNPAGDKNNYIVGGAIQLFNLKRKISTETGKGVDVFFIMDACRSNELPGGQEGQNFLNTAISEKKAGEIIMLATAAGEESLEDASIGNGHGLFTYYLIDGLTGSADSPVAPDNQISFAEIQKYVDQNVPSVALERFKRKQDPFFCCNEKSDKIISIVDTAYLKKWLKSKKVKSKGPGNSYQFVESSEINDPPYMMIADTTLMETYNLFNKAIKNNILTGNKSAEYYYQQLDKNFSGNPYTLDAKSTLAAEFINDAQNKVNRYLDCGDNASSEEKQANYDAAYRLEKAINILKEDDPDVANSYKSRMFFLMAGGDYGKDGKNGDISVAFEKAYAALAIDRDKAYIFNKLAQLHLQNNNRDSAFYYAEKATKSAPKWQCAFATLALVQKALTSGKPEEIKKKPNIPGRGKLHFGIVVGGGQSKPAVTEKPVTANDTISITGIKGKLRYDLGLIGQINLGNAISIRPSLLISFDQSDIVYERKRITGGPATETVSVKTTSFAVPIPIIIRFSNKNVAPFISAGPTFSFLSQKSDINSTRLPIAKFDVLGDVGLGVDFGVPKGGFIISPEIKYSRGLIDTHETSNSAYSKAITKFNRQAFVFSLYFRKR